MAREGADVAISYKTSRREAERTVAEIRELGVRSLAVPCDVTREDSVRTAVKTIATELGGIDILVNNAGNYEKVEFE